MNLLIDTQAFLWFGSGDQRLIRSARRLMQAPDSSLYVSLASLWKIAIKYSLGKLELEDEFGAFLQDCFEEGFQGLAIEVEHILGVAKLPFHHRDLFDRLIISQAIIEDFVIVTNDPVYREYDVRDHW